MVPWKHGNTLLSEISSFFVYALFREFRTPLDSEAPTPLYIYIYIYIYIYVFNMHIYVFNIHNFGCQVLVSKYIYKKLRHLFTKKFFFILVSSKPSKTQ